VLSQAHFHLTTVITYIRRKLQILYDDKMSKLKDEAMGKLKELGNSILGQACLLTSMSRQFD